MSMLGPERRDAIMRAIRLRDHARVSELAVRFAVSPVTIRRDLDQLEAEGRVERVHGGVRPARRDRRPAGKSQSGRPPEQPTVTFGAILPSVNYYYPKVLEGIRQCADELSMRVILGVSEYDADVERSKVERMIQLGVDGLLLATSADLESAESREWLAGLPVPVVLVERGDAEVARATGCDVVRSDHTAGAAEAVRHLLEVGHTRVGLLLDRDTPTAPLIESGWRDALRSHGGSRDSPLAAVPRDRPGSYLKAELVDTWRSRGVTAVLAHPDQPAAQVQHLAVADDGAPTLAVVSYDDEIAELSEPALTAVRPSKTEIGVTAVRYLRERMEGLDGAQRVLFVLPQLIVRDSTFV